MKVFLLFCVTLALTCGAIAREADRTLCRFKNPFLNELHSRDPVTFKTTKVHIFETPQQVSVHECRYEWSKFGSCCEPSSLKRFFFKELQLIGQSALALQEAVSDISTFSHRAAKFLRKYKGNISKALRLANGFSDLASSSEVTYFKDDSKKCWNYMNQLRASALCPICSGRSEIYFKDQKILVSPETCVQAVDSCKRFFKNIRYISETFSWLKDSYNDYSRWDSFERWTLKSLGNELTIYSPPSYLVHLFKEYEKAGHIKGLAQAIEICSMVVNVRKKPYVSVFKLKDYKERLTAVLERGIRHFVEAFIKAGEKIQETSLKLKNEFHKLGMHTKSKFENFGKESKKKFEDFGKKTKHHFEDVGRKTKKAFSDFGDKVRDFFKPKRPTKHGKARRLSLKLQSGSNVFSSDSLVFLTNADNMFTAVDGMKGTALFSDHSGYKPINLTLAFP